MVQIIFVELALITPLKSMDWHLGFVWTGLSAYDEKPDRSPSIGELLLT